MLAAAIRRRLGQRAAGLAQPARRQSTAPSVASPAQPAAAPAQGAAAAEAGPAKPLATGKGDWWYAGWATLFSVVLGGPAFFIYELKSNVETRLWAEENYPEALDRLRSIIAVMGDQAPPEDRLAGESLPVLGMLPGASGDEDCYEDERWGSKSEALLEAGLGKASGDSERGDDGEAAAAVRCARL